MPKPSETSIEDIYKKKDVHQHVLSEPDMWMGSTHIDKKEMWVYDDGMSKREIEYIPGLYKIYDEILVNARDQTIRDNTCKTIKVNINKETGEISVWNDGRGLPVMIHKEYKIYVPELIFANLLTSTNYDQKKKTTGGKNGLGAKLANIYSKKFVIDIVDAENKKSYYQVCEDNMYKINPPVVKSCNGKSYTKISFIPDYEKFGLDGLTDDIVALFKKRVYDIAGCTNNNVKVFLDDKDLNIKSFSDYISLFYNKDDYVYEEANARWRIGAIFDPTSGFRQISFVNGISTFQGGSHVTYIADQICKKVVDVIKNKSKKIAVKLSHVRDNLILFIDCVIEDPSFNSQSKEFLGSRVAQYGSECEISDQFIKQLCTNDLINQVIRLAQFKEESELKKTDGKKTLSINDIPKYEKAKWAGTRKSNHCRLILTEGDSAKSFALSGLEVIGREKYGVFPLKGKPINVREATISQLKNNSEFSNIKKILGLKQGKKYTSTSGLRYGGIIILTDADPDGSHIKGLLINMLHTFWPSLLKINGFIQSMATPIIKIYKKNDIKKVTPIIFYNITDYKKWVVKNAAVLDKWTKPKYYKGLGTSTEKEAKECFENFDEKVISYIWENPYGDENIDDEKKDNENNDEDEAEDSNDCDTKSESNGGEEDDYDTNDLDSKSYNAITLAFEKARTDDRKKWLRDYDKNDILDNHSGDIDISEFIHKDMKHFSNYDNIRSIPSMCDGLKPSLRKILYATFLKDRSKKGEELKVAQLGAYVAEKTDYHHGENSLYGAIIDMAKNYVCSNNLNLLEPIGNFGSRRVGGHDAASPRYIFTKLNPIVNYLCKKEDDNILPKQYIDDNDSNDEIEPGHYAPIIPIVLINGALGIGTGFSVSIPNFNPKDVANNLLRMLDGKEPLAIVPWYRGFRGKITKEKADDNTKYQTTGIYEILDDTRVRIRELPIGEWIENYIEKMKTFLIDDKKKVEATSKKFLTSVDPEGGNNNVNIVLTFHGRFLQTIIKNGEIDKYLKLTSTLSLRNMHLYNSKNQICKYDTIEDILRDFYNFRIEMYVERKKYMTKDLENKMNILNYKVKFIKDYINDKIVLKGVQGDQVIEKLVKLGYPKLSYNAQEENDDNKTYTYLTSMQIWSLTREKIDELEKECEKANNEYNLYLNTPVETLWKNEIMEFLEKYDKWVNDPNNDNSVDDKNVKQKSKPKVEKKIIIKGNKK